MIKSRALRWAGHVARMEEGRIGLKILTDKPARKRPFGRPRRRNGRTIYNFKMGLKEMDYSYFTIILYSVMSLDYLFFCILFTLKKYRITILIVNFEEYPLSILSVW